MLKIESELFFIFYKMSMVEACNIILLNKYRDISRTLLNIIIRRFTS